VVEDELLLVIAARGASISADVSKPPLAHGQLLQSGRV
jgi:hypothetical protein